MQYQMAGGSSNNSVNFGAQDIQQEYRLGLQTDRNRQERGWDDVVHPSG
jgi:hypothetical protein